VRLPVVIPTVAWTRYTLLTVWTHRASGVLLHPTSFPSPDGIGDLGAEARQFLDFLHASGVSVWQILPLQPVGPGDSPYSGISAFAGNPLLISLEGTRFTDGQPSGSPIVFSRARAQKLRRLQEFARLRRADLREREALALYREREQQWLDDFALFATSRALFEGRPWTEWPSELARRDPAALNELRVTQRDAYEDHCFLQLTFDRQWQALRREASTRGIRVLGDVPIFVTHDSADVWAHPHLFDLDHAGLPRLVAGVPPDYFSATGQLWGNPIYRWDRMAAEHYDWWSRRVERTLTHCDAIRLDHFRGFAACWAVEAHERTAERGRWLAGPGGAFFQAIERRAGQRLPIVAEDLGTISPDVVEMRRALGYPGMRILQFAFGSDAGNPFLLAAAANPYLPHNHAPDCVVYTGTHDNDTTRGWYESLSAGEQHIVRSYLGVSGVDIAWDLVRAALMSVASLAVVPLQDLLSLGSESRMNLPGTPDGNWTWRYDPGAVNRGIAERLRTLNHLYGRSMPPRAPAE